jgi:hypothetical protein
MECVLGYVSNPAVALYALLRRPACYSVWSPLILRERVHRPIHAIGPHWDGEGMRVIKLKRQNIVFLCEN